MGRVFISLMLLIMILSSCQDRIELASKGESIYSIIIPEDYTASDSLAAGYLSDYIFKMTGASLPIILDTIASSEYEICIGNTNRKDFNSGEMAEDAYIVQTDVEKIFIVGGTHKGTVYGVIDLLEYWGCRRFSPEEAYVPEINELMLPDINIHDEPLNTLRVINGYMTRDPEFSDWLRISTIQEFSPPGYYVHTFNKFLPREKYFKDHPEYYAWLDTKYSFDQLCPSNQEVKKIIIDKLSEEMETYPEFDIWSVSQDDNFSYCRCDKCAAIIEEEGSPAGPIIRLVNDIAAEFPDKVISTLAYQYSRPAPKTTPPADNVMVMLCTIELNRSRPIAEDSLSSSFVRDLTDWGQICNNIYLWDYTINFNHSVSPFPNLHVFQPNLQFFYENNVRKQFPQSNLTSGLEFSGLRARMIASLLWDPYINLDSVKNDFLYHYYGDASPFIRDYIDRMESELRKSGKILYIYEPPNMHTDGYLSEENVNYYTDLFDMAEQAVISDALLLNRVKMARLPLQYAVMEIGKNDMFGPRGWYLKNEDGFVLREDMKLMLERFYKVCKDNNIITLNERSLTPDIYYETTKRFIDVRIEGNKAFRKPVTAVPMPAEKYSSGDPSVLTNGVQGAHDFNVHWLGWWGKDAEITLDLEQVQTVDSIEIGTLWDGRSWILHPASISCRISSDGQSYREVSKIQIEGDQQDEAVTRKHLFLPNGIAARYVQFDIKGAGPLPSWHASEGEPSWFFVDEITVR
jgi:hypothetical protein